MGKVTKKCTTCKEEKDETKFCFRKNSKGVRYRNSICRVCRNLRDKVRYYRARKHLWEYKTKHPCVDCGETDPIVLEFDHIDASTKKFNIGNIPQNFSRERLDEEIAKCKIRCCNCHKRRTFVQLNHHDYGKMEIKPWVYRKRIMTKMVFEKN